MQGCDPAKERVMFNPAEAGGSEQIRQLLRTVKINSRMGKIVIGSPLAGDNTADERYDNLCIKMNQCPEDA